MAVVVVGGHTRNVGKTSVVAGVIAALPERDWTAIKITQFGHGICSADGKPCGCVTDDHTIAISEERNRESGTDTARYLKAGAAHAFWVRTRQGQLFEAMPRVRSLLAQARNVVIESNSVLQFLRPDLFLSVLDGSVEDFKGSARRYLDRADAVLWSRGPGRAAWCAELKSVLERTRLIGFEAPDYFGAEAKQLVIEAVEGH